MRCALRVETSRVLLLPVLLALAACGESADGGEGEGEASAGDSAGSDGSTAGSGTGTSGTTGSSSSGGTSAGSDDGGGEGGDPGDSGGASTGTSGSSSSGGSDSGGEGGDESGGSEGGGEPGQLSAGEWRDLDHWDFWRDLFEDQGPWAGKESYWSFFTSARFSVVVATGDVPVADAEVSLLDGQEPVWTTRTDNHGRAELFAGLFGGTVGETYTIRAGSGDTAVEQSDVAPTSGADPIPLELAAPEPRAGLDLMFVVDTTGSMGDELSYLQAELADVIQRVGEAAGQELQVRLSVNFYRDEGDEYVVRPFPFTADLDVALGQLAGQAAGGGGDFPEAVEAALQDAIFEHEWSDSAVARLLFLVLDAPPHYDQERIVQIQEAVREAARLGIRLVPLASSGVDKDTELLLRLADIATAGTYTFLTDDSGIGGPHLEPTIGEYTVERLNDLLVRIIAAAVQR